MSEPQECSVGGGNESGPSTTVAGGDSAVGRTSKPATGDDGQRDYSQPPAAASVGGGEDQAAGRDRPERSVSVTATNAAAPGPSSQHARGGGRAYQFRKAKSAATFMLDGVAYTIGEFSL